VTMRTVSLIAGHASEVASSVERLQVQRQAAAAARAHANALQIKVAVAVGCTLASVLGYSLHRSSAAVSSVDRSPIVAAGIASDANLAEARVGHVEVPYDGDTCRRFRIDNRSGAMTGESFAACGALEVAAQPATGPTRAEAIMNAFRVAR